MSSKVSVRGIVIRDDNSVVLMHRIKNGQEYRVIPGGGQEERESVEDTLRREIQEELGKSFIVKRDSEVARINKTEGNVDNVQHIFLGHYIEGIFEKDQGIEYIERSNEKNYYNPEFISEHDIFHINIVPKEVKQLLLQILSGNLDKDIIANINLQ